MRKSIIVALIIVILSFGISIYLYPKMPDMMVSHWDANGEPNDTMSKFWALFITPIISLFMLVLFVVLPMLDPLKKNIEKFKNYYDAFIVILLTFILYIFLLTVFWNLNYKFNMIQMLCPAFAMLFYYIGILLEKSKRNWFIGIRTPWTLSSDYVWNKTHKMGSTLFKIAGTVCLIGVVIPKYAIIFVIAPVISFSLYLVYYSYSVYKEQGKN